MRIIKKITLLFFLILIYIYALAIDSVSEEYVIFEGEEIEATSLIGLSLSEQETEDIEVQRTSTEQTTQNQTTKKLQLSLFDRFNLKSVSVSVLPRTTVIPIGSVVGLKLYTNGVLVVGMSEIKGEDSKTYKPYESCGIEEGDTIISINEIEISTTEELINQVNSSNGESIKVKYIHDEETRECSITPVQTSSQEYKLGLWVRDSAAGVGTVTFYEPSTKTFGALGHGITDVDTGELINIASGEFVTTKIVNIIKGETGNPGKIQGTVDNQANIGTIYKNSAFGIYGKVDNISNLNIDASKEMEVALRDEIEVGKATILCSLDNENVEEYEIEIEKIYKDNNYNNKSMEITVTDERLIKKTGGIIQGMSGSPIIQNGKFIGCVTHVLVNNPKKGYAVFGDLMIKNSKEVD